jgi:hypothetical protein
MTVKTGNATNPESKMLLRVHRSIECESRRILEDDSTAIAPMASIISSATANHSYYQLVVLRHSSAVISVHGLCPTARQQNISVVIIIS